MHGRPARDPGPAARAHDGARLRREFDATGQLRPLVSEQFAVRPTVRVGRHGGGPLQNSLFFQAAWCGRELQDATRESFSCLKCRQSDIGAVTRLMRLPGIGPVEASAVLSHVCPESYAFMSSPAAAVATGELSPSYAHFSEVMLAKAGKLRKLLPSDVERALMASYVLGQL